MAGEDPRYVDWLRVQPCHQCKRHTGCDPHHQQGAGMGMRNHDHTAIPMCRWCHEAWHAGARAFKLFDKHEKRAYHASAIEKYRKLYALSKGPGM